MTDFDSWDDDRSLGLCEWCFTMKDLRNGSTKCDTCWCKGGPYVAYDPFLDDEN